MMIFKNRMIHAETKHTDRFKKIRPENLIFFNRIISVFL